MQRVCEAIAGTLLPVKPGSVRRALRWDGFHREARWQSSQSPKGEKHRGTSDTEADLFAQPAPSIWKDA
jgi:hypothetical protein